MFRLSPATFEITEFTAEPLTLMDARLGVVRSTDGRNFGAAQCHDFRYHAEVERLNLINNGLAAARHAIKEANQEIHRLTAIQERINGE